jgi:hypothetical protein
VKRLLQVFSAALALLAVGLGWRLTQVLSVDPPVFEDPPQTAAGEPLAPAPRPRVGGKVVMDGIVGGNLFETERGYREEEELGADGEVEEPLPPPTNVVLNGVFFQPGGRPMVIMTDTSAGNKQLTLGIGDNVGEYQVGEITDTRVMLLGRGGQQFSVELDIKKGAQAVPARPTPRPAASANRAASPPARSNNNAQTPAQRAAQARAAAQRAAQQRAQQARQQAADGRNRDGGQQDEAQAARQDATQARLEALKRLREAAAAR